MDPPENDHVNNEAAHHEKADQNKTDSIHEEVLGLIRKSGLVILKVGRSGPMHKTKINLSEDGSFLVWRPKRKNPRQCRVPLEAVTRVTTGQVSRNFARVNSSFFFTHADADEGNDRRSVSFAWNAGKQSLDMIIKPSAETIDALKKKGFITDGDEDASMQVIVDALRWKVEQLAKLAHHEPVQARHIRELFAEADHDHSNSVDMDEALAISEKLNLGKPEEVIREAVERKTAETDGTLDLEAFTHIMLDLIGNHDGYSLWASYCNQNLSQDTATMPLDTLNNGLNAPTDQLHEFLKGSARSSVEDAEYEEQSIPVEKFTKFLLEVQKETPTKVAALLVEYHLKAPKAIAMAEKSKKDKKDSKSKPKTLNTNIDRDVFCEFIAGAENSVVSPEAEFSVYQDMTRPLNQYFIASSHNTYLTGDQLMSASSVDRYIDDLMEGCRCVELDCWDNSDGEPCIYHGGTMTSKISFRAVIQAVADYGFKKSPYPIILSFENHCSPPFQHKMAQHLKEILLKRDMLWLPHDSSLHPNPSSEPLKELPSPQEAMGKVIIKGKVGRFVTKSDSSKDKPDKPGSPGLASLSRSESKAPVRGEGEEEEETPGTEESETATVDELDELITIKGRKMKSLPDSIQSTQVEMIHSLKESKVEKVVSKSPALLVKLLEHKLIRTYPDNFRVDSSNYDPVLCWNYGCQVVALNYQTSDIPMQLNRGRFRDNGHCGYLLRPPFFQPEAEEKAKRQLLSASALKKAERIAAKEARLEAAAKRKAEKKAEAEMKKNAALIAVKLKTMMKKQKVNMDGETPEEKLHRSASVIQAAIRFRQVLKKNMKEHEKAEQEAKEQEQESDSDGEIGEVEDVSSIVGEDTVWKQPRDCESYFTSSKYGKEAMLLSVRILSASHLPAPVSSIVGTTTRSASFTDFDVGRKSFDLGTGSGEEDGGWEGPDKVNIEVEVCGVGCDQRQWAPSQEVGNDGVKHFFDEAFSCNIAEPRLSLIRFSVLRKGLPIAQTVIPVSLMRPGVRWAQLYDPDSQSNTVTSDFLMTRLMMVIKIEKLSATLMFRQAAMGAMAASPRGGGGGKMRVYQRAPLMHGSPQGGKDWSNVQNDQEGQEQQDSKEEPNEKVDKVDKADDDDDLMSGYMPKMSIDLSAVGVPDVLSSIPRPEMLSMPGTPNEMMSSFTSWMESTPPAEDPPPIVAEDIVVPKNKGSRI